MEQIAAEAGITKPIVYRHFRDKKGLYDALIHRYADRLLADLESALATESRPRQRIALTIDAYLRLVESEPMAYRFLMHRAVMEQPTARATVAGFTRHVAERIAEVLRAEFSRNGLDARAVDAYAHGLVGMVHQAGDWWLGQADVSRAELVERLAQWVWRGFRGLGEPAR
jgi:AcrR family transcriptional regulator